MNRKRFIKIVIVIGVVILLVLSLHLIGNSLFPMVKNHFGL